MTSTTGTGIFPVPDNENLERQVENMVDRPSPLTITRRPPPIASAS